jgi:hypothetical protein
MLPSGTPINPANALKWQSMFHVRAWLSGFGGGGVAVAGPAGGGGWIGGGACVWFSSDMGDLSLVSR